MQEAVASGGATVGAPVWRVGVALATVYVVWGSTYLAIRIMVETMPPLLSAGARFGLAGLVFLLVLAVQRGPARIRVSARQLGGAALVGTLLVFGGNGLVTVAEQEVPSAFAALIIASVPLWIVVMRVISHERPPATTVAGVGAGFVGVAVLLLPGGQPEGAPFWGVGLLVVAAASWAGGSFASARVPLPTGALLATGWEMLCGGLVMVAFGLALGEAGDLAWAEVSARSAAAWLYLVVAGSLLAFTAYVWLLANAPISTVATYAYVNPVIALALGALVLAEQITVTMAAGAATIVLSVAWVVRRESRVRAPAA